MCLIILVIDVEKLLRLKGILEPHSDGKQQFENKKEEEEYVLSVGSSYLLDSLNNDEVVTMNKYIEEREKVIDS